MSRKTGPKQALFEQLALIARALGSAARLELLDFLAQGERTVEEYVQGHVPGAVNVPLTEFFNTHGL